MTAVVERAENRLSDLIFWTGDDDNGTTLVSLREAKAALRALAPASGLAMLAELRAGVERLNRWRAEEGEKIKRQAKALTDLTKHCQRIEAENAGLARKIGKVQRGDGDHSQIADLEAKVINQRNELANLRARDGRLAELAVERDRLAAANAALEAKVAGLMEALKPFCFFSDEPNTTQEAWEIRYCDRFKDWIDFADIESARAELAHARADAQAAVADIVRSVWGRCEALEDEAADKLAQLEKLTDHEKGFWRGQKTVAKSIRRSTEMPTAEAIAIRRAEGGKA